MPAPKLRSQLLENSAGVFAMLLAAADALLLVVVC